MGLTSSQAHAIASRAVPAALGRAVEPAELWAVLVFGRVETGWGNWTSPPHAPDMVTSKNWGAVQCKEHASRFRVLGITDPSAAGRARAAAAMAVYATPSAVAGHCAMALDWLPKRGWFAHPYRWYGTHDEAAASVALTLEGMGVLEAVRRSPDTWTLAASAFDGGYYTGMSGQREKEVPIRARQLAAAVRAMSEKMGGVASPLAVVEADPEKGATFPAAPPRGFGVVSRDVAGAVVKAARIFRPSLAIVSPVIGELQAALNARGASPVLEVDGDLGPKTLRAWVSAMSKEIDP